MAKNASTTPEQNQEVEQLFQMGAHLGHRKSRVHPKSYKYIYKFLNGVSIIDLTKTVHLLNKARAAMKEAAKEGKKILVVATKKNHATMAAELATEHAVPFTTTKWLPGLLTNFETIIKNVQKLEKMKVDQAEGTWDQFVKHERMAMSKELYKLERFYRGLIGLKKRPDMLLIIDARKEKNSIVEADKNGIPVFGIVDTNSNPEEIAFPVVMNDDSSDVVKYVLTDLLKIYTDSYVEKKVEAPVETQETAAPAPSTEPQKPFKKEAPARTIVKKPEAAPVAEVASVAETAPAAEPAAVEEKKEAAPEAKAEEKKAPAKKASSPKAKKA